MHESWKWKFLAFMKFSTVANLTVLNKVTLSFFTFIDIIIDQFRPKKVKNALKQHENPYSLATVQ